MTIDAPHTSATVQNKRSEPPTGTPGSTGVTPATALGLKAASTVHFTLSIPVTGATTAQKAALEISHGEQ